MLSAVSGVKVAQSSRPVAVDAVAREGGDLLGAAVRVVGRGDAAEVAGPVLFAGQVGAPGRGAVGAVVERAAGLAAVGRVLGLQVVGLRGRAREGHFGQRVDAAVEVRVLLVAPGARALVDFDHADAVQEELALHFVGDGAHRGVAGADDGLAGRMQEQRRDGFVVHHEQAARGVRRVPLVRRVDAEEGHAVMVVAGALVVGGGRIGAVVGIGGHAGGDRVAEAVQHGGGIAGRHADHVVQALGDGREAELGGGRRRGRRGGRSGCRRQHREPAAAAATAAGLQQRGAGRADAQAEQMAAAQARRDQVVEGGVGAGVVADVVRVDRSDFVAGVVSHSQIFQWGLVIEKLSRVR